MSQYLEMQLVYILGDDVLQRVGPFPMGQGHVSEVGLKTGLMINDD